MEDPNEDTEWNDILRRKGILPKLEKPKPEDREEEDMTEKKENLDEVNLSDLDDDDEFIEMYRGFLKYNILFFKRNSFLGISFVYKQQRIKQLQAQLALNKFGSVREITGVDYVEQVNKAGDDIWVILHLYRDGIQLCNVINHHFNNLARKFPQSKFLKSVATTCIPNYPDKNLPTIFVYHEGNMKAQIIGPNTFSNNLSQDQLEWCLKEIGAVKSLMEENPNKVTRDAFTSSIRSSEDSRTKLFGE